MERVKFNRQDYLEAEDIFECTANVINPEMEMCEFSDDPEDLALELAYTRFALAKAEKENKVLAKWIFDNNPEQVKKLTDMLKEFLKAEIDNVKI